MNEQSVNKNEQPKNNKKLYIIIGAVLTAVIIAVLTIFVIIPSVKYSNAEEMLTENQFDDAKLIFEELGSFKNSKTMVNETQYQKAQYTLENKLFDEAQTMFAELGEYSDSKTMIDECTYQKAVNMIENKEFYDARMIFKELGEYSNSEDMINECKYQNALDLLEKDKYTDARKEFEKLEDYKDSETMVLEVDYVKGADSMESGDCKTAVICYKKLAKKEYKDSEDLLVEAYYARGNSLQDDDKLIDAYNVFMKIPEYEDTADILEDLAYLIYALGVDAYENDSELYKAEEYFEVIPEYENSKDYLVLILTEQCNLKGDFSNASKSYTDEELYAELVTLLDDYDNAEEIILGLGWIGYFLEGEWTDGKNTLVCSETAESQSKSQLNDLKNFEIEGSVVPGTYEIVLVRSNTILYVEVNLETMVVNVTPLVAIEYIDYNTIKVTSYSKGSIYTLDRVKD